MEMFCPIHDLPCDLGNRIAEFGCQFLYERNFVPLFLWQGTCSFLSFGLHRLPDDPGNESSEILVDELLDFNGEDFSRVHLPVQKFHNSLEFGWDVIRNEHHADAAGLQVRLHLLPELLGLAGVPHELGNLGHWVNLPLLTIAFVLSANCFHGPVNHGIGCIIEHLPDDFSPNSRIAAPLHFNEGRNGLLVEKEVV